MLWINLLVGQAIDPPVLSAEGDQAYCALSEQNIVTEFSIENNSGSTITAIYIQISLGYVPVEDVLRLTGSHNISSSWNPIEAKLTLKSTTSEVDFNNLVNAAYGRLKNLLLHQQNLFPRFASKIPSLIRSSSLILALFP